MSRRLRPACRPRSWRRVAAGTSSAIAVLALLIGGCTSATPAASAAASSSATRSTPAQALASPGDRLDAPAVDASLEAAAAAGPARFQVSYRLTDRAGYVQTMSRSDGVIDLSGSRGLATKEDFPGLSLSTTRELALVGNRVFSRPVSADADWEEGYGGARAFVGLDVAGDSAMAVVKAALATKASWVVVASEPSDPSGSIRIRPDTPDASDVAVVIDAAGRLVSVARPSKPTNAGGGQDVHELTFTEFGVPLEFDAPG
jgi:hypothetical protein